MTRITNKNQVLNYKITEYRDKIAFISHFNEHHLRKSIFQLK